MCGRYTLKTSGKELAEVFQVPDCMELEPRFNVAPTNYMPIVHIDLGQRRMMRASWGLVPFWAKSPHIGSRLINARSETAHQKNAFRTAMRKRRCLVPVDGWYEWKRNGRERQPYRFHRADDKALGIAGLYEHWVDPEGGEVLDSFTILTTKPNALAAKTHDRMPVILAATDWDQWLDPTMTDMSKVTQLCLPWMHDDLVVTPVSKDVGNVRNDRPDLIDPVELEPQQGSLF